MPYRAKVWLVGYASERNEIHKQEWYCEKAKLNRSDVMKKQNCYLDPKFVEYFYDEGHHWKVCLWVPHARHYAGC